MKIPDDCSYPVSMIQAAQNQMQNNIGSLAEIYHFKIGAEIILTVRFPDLKISMQRPHALSANSIHE